MESKFYVSLKAAKLLKEKGFNEECGMSYNEKGEMLLPWDSLQETRYPAPTKAEAIDWLESKGKVVELRCDYDELHKDDSEWIYYIYQYENEGRLYETVSSWGGMDGIFDTRLEAEEAAIIKACELL